MNLQKSEEYKLKTETYGRELLAGMYMEQYLKEKNTEDAQRKYYEENKKKYEMAEMVRISVIRTKTEEQAKEVLEKAKKGEDFAKLAEKYSSGPAADKGGDFGFRERKTLRKEFGDIAFSMKKGEIKGPIKLADGYHIIKLTDYREGGIASFEDVKKRVAYEYNRKLIDEKIKELKKAYMVHIDEAELKNLKID
jgi:parvulin-like peptidyl-prolyl isomerase